MKSKSLENRLRRIAMPDLETLRQAEAMRRMREAFSGLSYEQLKALRALYARGTPPTSEELEQVFRSGGQPPTVIK